MTANFNHNAPRERGSTPEQGAGAFGSSAGAVGRAVGPGRRGGGTELEAPLWAPPGTCWGWGSPTRGPPWTLPRALSVAPVWGYSWWHKGSGAVAVPQGPGCVLHPSLWPFALAQVWLPPGCPHVVGHGQLCRGQWLVLGVPGMRPRGLGLQLRPALSACSQLAPSSRCLAPLEISPQQMSTTSR